MYCLGSRLYINWPATHNCIQASKAIQTAFLSVPEEQLQKLCITNLYTSCTCSYTKAPLYLVTSVLCAVKGFMPEIATLGIPTYNTWMW